MPTRVRLAVAALGVLVAYAVVVTARVLPVAIVVAAAGATVAADLVRGRPAAMWTARLLAFAALNGLAILGILGAIWFDVLFAAILISVCGVTISVGLAGRSAMRYFDLYCVHCHTMRVRFRGLGFRTIECRKCGRRWEAHSHHIDPAVFD